MATTNRFTNLTGGSTPVASSASRFSGLQEEPTNVFSTSTPYQTPTTLPKSYPTPPVEPHVSWLDSLKSGISNIFTGYTTKEKAQVAQVVPMKPTPQLTIEEKLKQALVPPKIDQNLTISAPKVQAQTPEWQAWQQQQQQDADILHQKIEAAKIKPEEYFARGITFGYAGDAGYNNKAPAVTLSQKGLELAGSIVGWMTLGKFLGPVAETGVAKIPGGTKALETATNAMQKSVITRNIFNPVNAAKALGTGLVGGLISKADNIDERIQNSLNAGKTFLVFDTLAYPVVSFFRPTWYSLGSVERTKVSEAAKNYLPDGTSAEQIFNQPKEIYFKNPNDPTLVLKVTQSTSGKANLDIVPEGQAGVKSNTLPEITKTQAELFRSEPSLYDKLVTFLGGSKETGIPSGAIKGEIVGAPQQTGLAKPQPIVSSEAPVPYNAFTQAAEAVEPGVAQVIANKISENIRYYQTNGGAGVGTESPSAPLRDLAKYAQTPTAKEITSQAIDNAIKTNEIIPNPDGTITLYRVGKPSVVNDLMSATYDRAFAESFDRTGKAPITEIKAMPQDISYFIGGVEKEVLLPRDFQQAADKRVASNQVQATQGPGYQQFSERLDTMVQNKTIYPEDADILKALFMNTRDEYLGMLNVGENARIRALGRFSIMRNSYSGGVLEHTNKLQMQSRLTQAGLHQADQEPAKVFTHEFGHAGWYLILTESERNMVTQVYKQLGREGRIKLFKSGLSKEGTGGNAAYYAKNDREFFAESFAQYIWENKIPVEKMRPLLMRLAGKFFDGLKWLVNRGKTASIERLKPLYEKILAGDKTTPLSEFAANAPPSFKQELQTMFETLQKPNENGIFVKPQGPEPTTYGTTRPVKTVTPTFSRPAPLPTEGAPIDLAAKILEARKVSLPPEIPVEPLEKVIQGDSKTPLDERVNLLDYLRTPWKVFEKMKIRPQYEGLLAGYDAYLAELPKNIDKITAWSKEVPAESNERIFRALDGEKINLNPAEIKVAGEIKTWLAEWADRLGMEKDARISEYITHIFPFGKGGEIPEEIAFLINKKIPGSVYDPFLLQRQGAEGYIKNTWKALDAYVKRATRKVNMDPALADLKAATDKMTDTSQLNYLNRYVGSVNLRPTELDSVIDNFIKQHAGYLFGARPTSAITRFLRMTISRAKIGGSITSFAKNLTQGVNTFSELGTWYTTKGYLDLVRYGGKELKENGVLNTPFIEDRTYSAVKKMAEKFDTALFLNMTASELVNRGAAYYGAKSKFLKGKTTPKEYREAFGKPMPEGYTPTMEDAIHYGKFVSSKTQFLFGPLDTPVGLSSDISKTAAQFSTFGLKQSEFIINMIGQKNWWKLIRYLASSMLLFSFVGSMFGMKWSDSLQPFKFGAPPAWSFFTGLFDAITGAKNQYNQTPSVNSRIRTVENTLFTNLVPGGAQLNRSYQGLQAVNQGASRGAPSATNPQGAYQYSIPQTPMNYIRGTLFGKASTDQGQAYYNKTTPKSSGGTSNRFKGL